jgi:CubicO group peptidase (beta-lactamase class C family)
MILPPTIDWSDAGIGPGPDVVPELRVTRENWRIYPFSRWAFQHTRELVPSRAVLRSDASRLLPMGLRPLDSLAFRDDEGKPMGWEDFVQACYADAMIILHKGSIIYETYRNGMTPHTLHHCFSVTKSFVGLLAEILVADGTLDAEAPVTVYAPELASSGFARASVRHLLDMTDGVAFDEDYANPDADVHRYSASYWTPAQAKGGARETLSRLTVTEHLPGGGFSYRTPVADALGWVIERASGERLADLFTKRLWQPAGCEDDGHFLVDTAGQEIAASGLNATIPDLARLALLMLEEHPAIPNAARMSILNGADRALLAASRHSGRGGSYRSQWWVSHNGHDGIAATGVYGQRVYLEPGTGLAFICFGSHPVASNMYTDVIHRNALDALRQFVAT